MTVSSAPIGARPEPIGALEPAPASVVRLVDGTTDRLRHLRALLEIAGDAAVASHAAAAHLWGFPELVPWRAEVSSPRCDRYRLRKVRAHRTLDLRPEDITMVRGIRCTTVARTIVDLSGRCSAWELLEVYDRAAARGFVHIDALRSCSERLRQAPGRRRSVVRAVLERRLGPGPFRAALAERVSAVLADAGLPPLSANMPVAVGTRVLRLPLTYPAARVAVACETWGYAATPVDRSLRHGLAVGGWRVVPVRWPMTDADIVRAVGMALQHR